MSIVSGAQMAVAKSGVKNSGSFGIPDDPNTLGDPMGGWKGDLVGPEAHSASNLSSAQKPLAFRSPDLVGIGANTIGTWQGFGPAWHERYKND